MKRKKQRDGWRGSERKEGREYIHMAEKEKFVVQLAWLSGTRHLLQSQTN